MTSGLLALFLKLWVPIYSYSFIALVIAPFSEQSNENLYQRVGILNVFEHTDLHAHLRKKLNNSADDGIVPDSLDLDDERLVNLVRTVMLI